jgi:hypothetical protein
MVILFSLCRVTDSVENDSQLINTLLFLNQGYVIVAQSQYKVSLRSPTANVNAKLFFVPLRRMYFDLRRLSLDFRNSFVEKDNFVVDCIESIMVLLANTARDASECAVLQFRKASVNIFCNCRIEESIMYNDAVVWYILLD